jgi:aldehyde:ferredoxin oxidoreductase
MNGGYMGKILFVDLSKGEIREEALDAKVARDFIGCYGIGARILYSRQKPGADPMGPDNMLGFVTGPLTGSVVPTGSRYMVVGKSPLTKGWGDANSGGSFGPYLKFAGFDAVFFTGISPKPVYLLLDNGKAELKDAAAIWGKDTYYTEDTLMEEYGKNCRVACIGPSGEKLSLIAGIMTDHGSAAARSGLGAVMGSKKLKAIVARGDMEIPLADKAAVDRIRVEQMKQWQTVRPNGMSEIEQQHKYGTSISNYTSMYSGDSPVKNWGGIGVKDMPEGKGMHQDAFAALVDKGHACWHCPVACKAVLKAGEGEYKYAAGVHRPEYETVSAFGCNCLNNHTESINMVNDICNRAGLDTISGGSVVAFAIECYENGIISKEDTGGIELKWGDHRSIVQMTEKVCNREGIGNILADGVKVAAEKIGKGSEKYAVHVGGQEPGMHDPKLPKGNGYPMAAARLLMDATPGRHMLNFGSFVFFRHVVNMTGICFQGGWSGSRDRFLGFINGVTGANYTMDDITQAGERTANIRHAFNLREGIVELNLPIHPRIIGKPPQTEGPLANCTSDIEAQIYWGMGSMDWDRFTTKPSKAKLLSLGLDDVAKDLWP